MSKNFDYTKTARKIVTRFPVLNAIFVQIFFWILAYAFLAILAHLLLLTAGSPTSLKANIVIALFFGFFNGLASGLIAQFFERQIFYKRSLALIILGKAIISLIVFIILISVVRSILFPYLSARFFHAANPVTLQQSWDAFFYLLLIYTIVIGLVISFINVINKKYGPGVLLPLLLGRYRNPKEEERIFLFMDLKSSTSIAEALGHLKYSAFIRDSFMDINSILPAYRAQIYQYVGDEIVITWTMEEGLSNLSCIRFFFSCEASFKKKADYYKKKFGQVPEFKAGLHMGKVTAVEVGNIKREIAYHGDTLNTTARIQGVCNQYKEGFLTSMHVLENTSIGEHFKTQSIGMIKLKGKSEPIEIASINLIGVQN
jgi:adenylate cyclase